MQLPSTATPIQGHFMKSLTLFLTLLFAAVSVQAQTSAQAVLTQLPGTAKDIDIGSDGSIWRIGVDSTIARFEEGGWTKIDGTASRIAVDNFGFPWVVRSTGEILRRNGRKWIVLSGTAVDIDINQKGDVWVVGRDGWIRRWGGEDWVDATKADAARIAVDWQGIPYVIDSKGEVPSIGPTRSLGAAKAFAAGADGSLWLIGSTLSVSKWTSESKWKEEIKGTFSEITIDNGGSPILIDTKGNIFRASSDKLEPPAVFPPANDPSACENIARQRFATIADTPAKIAELGSMETSEGENGFTALCSATTNFTKTIACFTTSLTDYRDTDRAVNECRLTPLPEKPRSIVFRNSGTSRARVDLVYWIYEKGQLIKKVSAANVVAGQNSTLMVPRYLARSKGIDLSITSSTKPTFRTTLPFDFSGERCFNNAGPC